MHDVHDMVPAMAIHDVQDRAARVTPMTPVEACSALGISRATLNRYVDAGTLHPTRLPSGHRRFAVDEIAALIAGEPWEPRQ